MLHVLGLSFGKRNANCDILCKEALYGVREAFPDAEIKFICGDQIYQYTEAEDRPLHRLRSMFRRSGARQRQ